MRKPDFKALQPIVHQLQQLLTAADAVVGDEVLQLQAAEEAIRALQHRGLQRIMEALPVETLNQGRQGIRVSVLREAGLTNVWQVYCRTTRGLDRIHGIGHQGAERIRAIVDEMAEATGQTLAVRLDLDDPTREQRALQEALYRILNTREIRETCRTFDRQVGSAIRQDAATIQSGQGFLRWTFASRERKQALLDAELRLTSIHRGPERRALEDCLHRYHAVLQAGADALRQDLLRRPAAYQTLLVSLLPEAAILAADQQHLPKALVEEVEAHAIDLSLMRATLRPYQVFGCKYILHQKQVLLGDEMGLGKTVQAIAAMAALAAKGHTHFMVVCPASVLVNWCREVKEHSRLEPVKIHGADTEALAEWLKNGGVAVTTYESISRFELPETQRIALIVTDEAHYVKNPRAQRTRALQRLMQHAERTAFMTGTPLENRVEEMCFLVRCLQPEVADRVDEIRFLHAAPQFREALAPVYLRRTREDVLQELPELVEKKLWSDLEPEELAAYQAAVAAGNFMAMRQVSWQVDDLAASSKAQQLLEVCAKAEREQRKVIVFSFFRKTLEKVQALLGDRCMDPITGDVPPARRQEILDAFCEAPDGAVLVAQIQAGGTGLNIQTASVIVFCEPQLKPSLETQAVARAYRMGQLRNVLVYRLLCEDCIDEVMLELLADKQAAFDAFADESVVGDIQLRRSEQQLIATIIRTEQERLEQE